MYKHAEKNIEADDINTLTDVWLYHFGKYDAKIVHKAMLTANLKSKFFIQPADIFTEIEKMATAYIIQQNGSPVTDFETMLEILPRVARIHAEALEFPNQKRTQFGDNRTFREWSNATIGEIFNKQSQNVRDWLQNKQSLIQLAKDGCDNARKYKQKEFIEFCKQKKENIILFQGVENLKIDKGE